MTKLYNGKYSPFKNLKNKISYIKASGVRFYDMFSKDGNKEMELAIQKVVDFILNEKRLSRKKAVELLIVEWSKVHDKHKESYDTDIKESTMWYIDACLEFRGKNEVTSKEMNNLK